MRVLQFNAKHFESRRDSVEPTYTGWLDKSQDVFACFETDALHVGVRVLTGETVDFRGKGRIEVDGVSAWFSFWVGLALALLFFLLRGGL